jgi:alanine racemase
MSLQTTITRLRRIRAGEGVSYGRRYIAPHETTIATLPIGYGDGYFRGFTGKTWCLIHGTKYPIVGTICMDACMVDVGNADVAIGDVAVLLGEQQGADGVVQRIDAMELAAVIDSIPYEVLTAISERVPRAFVGRLSTVAQLGEVSSV